VLTATLHSFANKKELLRLLGQFSEIEGLNENPFLSYSWQYSWISSLPTMPTLVTFESDGLVIGYTLYKIKKIIPSIPIYCAFVNQMGNSTYDQVWIEFNDIICIKNFKYQCVELLINKVMNKGNVAKLTLSMCDAPKEWLQVIQHNNYRYEMEQTPGFRKPLGNINCVKDVLIGLSRNSRNKMNRAIRDAETTFGQLSVKKYGKSETEEFLHRMGLLHKKQWMGSSLGSGFANKYFLEHHKTLCSDFFDNVDLVEVRAGDVLLGLSYNLIHNKHVYFYCSGINNDAKHGKLKPGYIMHILLMSYYGKIGFEFYDFMAGDSQYKRTLSSEEYKLYTLELYKNSIMINTGRYLFRLIKKLFSKF
tara:strand:- start:784 stop:1872 length:1089 start_codon:yes stop_codon:yes gene_type:complete